MGVDMATYKELIAAHLNVTEICQKVGADSLAYLTLPGMLDAIEKAVGFRNTYCNACFSGAYPVKIPVWLNEDERNKAVFESVWG
jgi:amidophosphoribosyltransferase